jgi:hypothetical protein
MNNEIDRIQEFYSIFGLFFYFRLSVLLRENEPNILSKQLENKNKKGFKR